MENRVIEISDLSESVQASLKHMGIHSLSDVQKAVIPSVMDQRDVLVRADTAAGKTLAYALPLIERLEVQGKGRHLPQALILVPTRELAVQTASVIRELLAKTEGIRTAVLAGGTDMNAQVRAFSRGADIVIATPARLLDHIRRHTFKPKKCGMLVLDEADVMMSFGFHDDVLSCTECLGPHQTVMLSATWTDAVKDLAMQLLNDPEIIEMKSETVHPQKISYSGFIVSENRKLTLTEQLIRVNDGQTVVFCSRRATADFVCGYLKEKKYRCEAVHSESDMKVRRRIMDEFRQRKTDILCATDVLARGIDLPEVSLVILFDCPENAEAAVHRTGRTSRRMKPGEAVFLFTPGEKKKADLIADQLNAEIPLRRF